MVSHAHHVRMCRPVIVMNFAGHEFRARLGAIEAKIVRYVQNEFLKKSFNAEFNSGIFIYKACKEVEQQSRTLV